MFLFSEFLSIIIIILRYTPVAFIFHVLLHLNRHLK